ncbi:hypothetical protein E3N88_36239 [Mikania micrantha]|uniref:Uncharacterized protein n=1 Tax=Mikania micrantha TaxID=192012 RepID=A0A5N6M364_9ASTR|nr:hypothetical protein E3N88_36239 [Mikania micrantha]
MGVVKNRCKHFDDFDVNVDACTHNSTKLIYKVIVLHRSGYAFSLADLITFACNVALFEVGNGGFGEACIMLFGFNDKIKFARMGIWAKIHIWTQGKHYLIAFTNMTHKPSWAWLNRAKTMMGLKIGLLALNGGLGPKSVGQRLILLGPLNPIKACSKIEYGPTWAWFIWAKFDRGPILSNKHGPNEVFEVNYWAYYRFWAGTVGLCQDIIGPGWQEVGPILGQPECNWACCWARWAKDLGC